MAGHGATEVYAWVTDANRNAMRFYGHLGFGPTGDHPPITRAPDEWETLLVRQLTSSRA